MGDPEHDDFARRVVDLVDDAVLAESDAPVVAAGELLQETAFLLRSPTNARRLMAAMAQVDQGRFTERELDRAE